MIRNLLGKEVRLSFFMNIFDIETIVRDKIIFLGFFLDAGE